MDISGISGASNGVGSQSSFAPVLKDLTNVVSDVFALEGDLHVDKHLDNSGSNGYGGSGNPRALGGSTSGGADQGIAELLDLVLKLLMQALEGDNDDDDDDDTAGLGSGDGSTSPPSSPPSSYSPPSSPPSSYSPPSSQPSSYSPSSSQPSSYSPSSTSSPPASPPSTTGSGGTGSGDPNMGFGSSGGDGSASTGSGSGSTGSGSGSTGSGSGNTGSSSGTGGSGSGSGTGKFQATSTATNTGGPPGNPTNNPLVGKVDPNSPIYIPYNATTGQYDPEALKAVAAQACAASGTTTAAAIAAGNQTGGSAGNAGSDQGTWQVANGPAKGVLYAAATMGGAAVEGYTTATDQAEAAVWSSVETGADGSLSGRRDFSQAAGTGVAQGGQGPVQITAPYHPGTNSNNPAFSVIEALQAGKDINGGNAANILDAIVPYNSGVAGDTQGQTENRGGQSISYAAYLKQQAETLAKEGGWSNV